MGVDEPHRLHGPVRQGEVAPGRHHFQGQTTFEIARLLEGLQGDLVGPHQGLIKEGVFRLAEGTVEVVVPGPVAGGPEDPGEIKGIRGDDGGDGVVKMKMLLAGEGPQGRGQGFGGERPGGDDAGLPSSREVTSSRMMVTRGSSSRAREMYAAKASRSTARARPAGTRVAPAAAMMREPSRRISSLRRPTALSTDSARKELLHTSSPSRGD